jgi:hypothetical protein
MWAPETGLHDRDFRAWPHGCIFCEEDEGEDDQPVGIVAQIAIVATAIVVATAVWLTTIAVSVCISLRLWPTRLFAESSQSHDAAHSQSDNATQSVIVISSPSVAPGVQCVSEAAGSRM